MTVKLPLVGAPKPEQVKHRMNAAQGEHIYGTEAVAVHSLPGADQMLTEGLSEAMVRFAARYEYARTVEDVLLLSRVIDDGRKLAHTCFNRAWCPAATLPVR